MAKHYVRCLETHTEPAEDIRMKSVAICTGADLGSHAITLPPRDRREGDRLIFRTKRDATEWLADRPKWIYDGSRR